MGIVGNFARPAWIIQRGVQQLFGVYEQNSLDIGDGF